MDKRYYGQYRFKAVKGILGNSVPAFPAAIQAIEARIRKAVEAHGVDAAAVTNVKAVMAAEAAIMNGMGEHVFMGPEAEEVARRAVGNLSAEDVEAVDLKTPQLGVVYSTTEEPVLFMTATGKLDALVVVLESVGCFAATRAGGWIGGEAESFVNTPSGVKHASDMPGASVDMARLRTAGRLVVGALLMRQAFPEMFLEGPPERIRHPAWYTGVSNTVTAHLNKVRAGVSPHMRNCHFRVLRHARYKLKRGTVVFVRASMVKGKAKHTEGTREEEQL